MAEFVIEHPAQIEDVVVAERIRTKVAPVGVPGNVRVHDNVSLHHLGAFIGHRGYRQNAVAEAAPEDG